MRRCRVVVGSSRAAVLILLLTTVSGTAAVRKCCAEQDAVMVAWTATGQVQCVRSQEELSATVWAREVEGRQAQAGTPPACVGRATARVWVLETEPVENEESGDGASGATGNQTAGNQTELPGVAQLPPNWWTDDHHFCLEALQLGDRRNNLTARLVVVGCLSELKSGSEDFNLEDPTPQSVNSSYPDGNSGSGSGDGVTVVLLGNAALPVEPPWTGGDILWADAVNGVQEHISMAPWSWYSPASPPPKEAKSMTLRVAVGAEGAGILRKCCPRGQGLNLEKHSCVPLETHVDSFPSRTTLRLRENGGVKALLVGPTEGVNFHMQTGNGCENNYGGSRGTCCPLGTARSFHVVSHVIVETAGPNDGDSQVVEAAETCVDAPWRGGGAVVARCAPRRHACDTRAGDGESVCVAKCCPVGYAYIGKECGRSPKEFAVDFKHSFTDISAPERISLIEQVPRCEEGFYPLSPAIYADDSWYLQRDGRVFRPALSVLFTLDGYCLERVDATTADGQVMQDIFAFICMDSVKINDGQMSEENPMLPLLTTGLLLSALGLALTVATYALLPVLRNLHGKTVMAHAVSQLIAFVVLAIAQNVSRNIERAVCKAMGYSLLFWLYTNFSWLNVLCFDIWWTFGATRGRSEARGRARSRRRFALYSAYAWGLPALLASAAITLNENGEAWGVPARFRPNIAIHNCFLVRGTVSRVLYLQVSLAVMVGVNAVLFALTARRCTRIKAEMARLSRGDGGCGQPSFYSGASCHSSASAASTRSASQRANGDAATQGQRRMARFRADSERFLMNTKLFVAMGVPWVLDVISDFIIEPRWVWYVPEALLSLQGVFIFCIFVLKRKVLQRIRKRLSSLCSCCCCCCCERDEAEEGGKGATARGTVSARETAPSVTWRQPLAPHAANGANARPHVQKSASSSTLCTLSTSLRHSPTPTRTRAER